MPKDPPPSRGNRRRRSNAIEEERNEKLQQLILCREPLSPAEAELLREVFQRIVAIHREAVWRHLLKAGIPADNAKDLFQDIFATLYIHLLETGFREHLSWTIRAITNNKIMNFRRTEKRSPLSLGVPSSGSEKPTSSSNLDRTLDRRAAARHFFSQLSSEHREVIELIELQGMSYGEAVAILQIPEGTLRSRVTAARRALLRIAQSFLTPSERGAL